MVLLFRILAVTALVAVLGSVPATASASRAKTSHAKAVSAASTTALALKVARRTWGATPCNGKITVVTGQRLAAGLGPDSDAWVTFSTPLGANDLAAAPAVYTNCTIALAKSRWPSRTSMLEDWDVLCMTMTHELGHLLGHQHDTTPGSVMLALFTDYSSEPAACRTTRPAGAPAS